MSESRTNNEDNTSLQIGNRRVGRSSSRNASLQNSQEDLSKVDCGPAVKIEESSTSNMLDTAGGVSIECAVCLQTCIHPVKLPCSHIFCFLCVKGVAFSASRRCAMCRQEIPADFLLHPQLLFDRTQLEKESTLEDGYQWFYEGRNGWWQYDERTSHELECAYKRSQRVFELLIAGFLYIIDFDQMLQYRKTEPSKRRRIKRDLASIAKKGVAGLRLVESNEDTENGSASASQDLLSVAATRAALNSNCLSPNQTPAPSNTPQTPQTPRSPPSPSPESRLMPNQDSATQTTAVFGSEERWQERERRRLRRAVEEIERLRLNSDRINNSHLPLRLDNMVIYYNLDEETSHIVDRNQDLWPSEDSSTTSEEDDLSNVHT